MLNHKMVLCVCLVILLAVLGSADIEPEPVLVKHINQQNLDGAGLYKHEIEVTNGIQTSAQGDVNRVQGEYLLPGEDGKPPIRVTYTADSTGFHPHIN